MSKIGRTLFSLSPYVFALKKPSLFIPTFNKINSINYKHHYNFCSTSNSDNNKPPSQSTTPKIPKQNLQIKHSEAQVGDQHVDAYNTKDHYKIKGTKQTQTGQLYALMFRCGKCNTQSIRSFTKNAYHHGIVLIRCEGCQNIHLVADNIGWFGPDMKNIENMGEGKVQKVYDPIAVTKFLNAAFLDKQKSSTNTKTEQKTNVEKQSDSKNQSKNKDNKQ